MLKCVIFDMDGTIADTVPLCIASFRGSIEALSGRTLSDREIINTFGPSEEGTIASFLPNQFNEGLDLYLKYYEQMHAEMCPEAFPGMSQLFLNLRRNGLKIALVTGKGEKSLAISMRILNLNDSFECIKTGSPAGPNKSENISDVLKILNISSREAVYVGDAASDIDAARDAGVSIISAAWANTADIEAIIEKQPDKICYSVRELFEYFLGGD